MKKVILIFVVILASVITLLWTRLDVISLGYIHQNLQKEKKKKLNNFYKLKLQHAELVSPFNIEKKASGLGFIKPNEKQFRYIGD